MYKDKRILAIIPARSGSKGMKDKNITPLCGKPMIAYTMEAALESGIFEDVVVSTDSPLYAEIAKGFGASVPGLRPEELSHDRATSADVVLYTLDLLEKQGKNFDYFVLLQPTSPLRTHTHIVDGIKLLMEQQADSVVSLCPCAHPPEWTCKEEHLSNLSYFATELKNQPRQTLKSSYQLNGSLFIAKVSVFREEKNFFCGNSVAYLMKTKDSVDVDDKDGFLFAEYLLQKQMGTCHER